MLAVQHLEAHYRVDAELFSPRADYLLRVRGTSMKDAGILDGDLLAVHKTAEARPGQIVVARVEDEVTVKRFSRRRREIVLSPEDPASQPIVVDPTRTAFRRNRGGRTRASAKARSLHAPPACEGLDSGEAVRRAARGCKRHAGAILFS